MKSIYRRRQHTNWNFGLGLALAVLILQGTLAQQSKATLTGTWTIDMDGTYAQIDQDIKAQMEMMPEIKTTVLAAYQGRSLSFGADGTYVQQQANGPKITGKWQLQGRTLHIDDGQGHKQQQELAQLTSEKLVLLQPRLGDTRPYFSQLHFIKN